MYSKFVKFCSIVLTVALLINLLPLQVLGSEFQSLIAQSEATTDENIGYDEPSTFSDSAVLWEIIEKRTEFSKEYKMSNGLNMVVVYPEAVHYQKDSQWEEIDNTLVASTNRSLSVFQNQNNSWQVSLPQQLSKTNKVTVEKDGYTVSFGMAGERRQYATRTDTEKLSTASNDTVVLAEATKTTAQIISLNYDEIKRASVHPETVADTVQSRLRYCNVYQNTDVQYDLNSYQLKESIILNSYNSAVQGYDFFLETNELTPVLQKDNSILLQTKQGETIMTLPAPYMIDNNGVINRKVGVTLTQSTNGYLLSYQMPMEWLADASRAWPVVLDPIVVFEMYRQNLKDQFVAEDYYEDYNHGVMYCGYYQYYGKMRSFLRYVNLPELTSADVIVNATLSLYRNGGSVDPMPVEAHKVLGNWDSQTITWANKPQYNSTIEDYSMVGGTGRYSWEITDIARDWYASGNLASNTGVMLKAPDSVENSTTNFWKKFYTIDYDITDPSVCPQMYIYFKNNNGIESYWDYTSTSAGRAGTGYVNNYSGNLTWMHSDIGFGGNRMPVSINHVYNTNDSNKNIFGLGYGWRTNFNQVVGLWSTNNNYYFWEDGDGTTHYFEHESGSTYKDEDGLGLTLTVSNGAATITDKNGNKSFFDTQGRLYKIENNQATKSNISITYLSSTSKLISKITDGVGRVYNFTYTNNLLNRISYVGKGATELSYVTFGYSGSNLTSITDKDNESSIFTYGANNLLTSAQDVDGYKLAYTYSSGLPKRVIGINEYDNTVAGGYMTIAYAHNQTTITDHNGNTQILQFNDWGNLISIQDDQGRAQYARYARNNYDDQVSKANQMNLSSKMQNTVSNLLANGSFEYASQWYSSSNVVTVSRSTETAYLGSYSQKVTCSQTGTWPYFGAFTDTILLSPGATITVSAYIKTVDATVTVGIERQSDYAGFDSEIVPAGKDWSRHQVSYTNTSNTADAVRCFLYFKSPGTAYIDCVQAEYCATASRYNIIENGDFRNGINRWNKSSYCNSNDTSVILAQSAAPQLDTNVFRINGSPTTEKSLSQTLYISGSAGDSYVLSGWAKGDSVPLYNDTRVFGLSLTFHNNSGSTTTEKVSFNADCRSDVNWQYAATGAAAKEAYYAITIKLEYSKNANTVYFDGIQLFKETFGTSYTYDNDGNIRSVVDLQNEATTYEYQNNNLTKIMQGNKAKMRYEYDNYHNVIKAVTQVEDASGNIVDGIEYNFVYDTYGNNISANIGGQGGITTTATYTPDGNRLLTTKDELANVTTYCYNEDTNVLEWVKYPNDTDATRTNYTYDELYRMATASAAVPGLSDGTALTASYTYEDDLLTEIQTASTSYEFAYGYFGVRTGVRIGSDYLALYEYTAKNRYLEAIEYGNGHVTGYEYDKYGRLIEETFDDGSTVTYTYDNTGALATMTDSATGRKTTYYYDLIDRLVKYTEVGSNYNHSVEYIYDARNNLTQLKETVNGVEKIMDYIYDDQNRIKSVTINGVTRTYAYDAYGRVSSKNFSGHGGDLGNIDYYYVQSGNLLSSRVDTIHTVFDNLDLLFIYTHDANGNILSFTDETNTDTYAYDSANQLIRENNLGAGKTWTWTYDNAGNILAKNEYAYTTGDLGTPIDTILYTYGDSSWGDLLTAYDGIAITHDAIGNPLNDGTWTYTWQNGRDLAAMTDGTTTWTYTYDANGMRTQRSNGTTAYNYVYNGSQLSQMTVGSNMLNFAYDASGIPMMVTYNGTKYYYIVNLQGDIMGIVDSTGTLVVYYTYDAWGNPLSITGFMADTLGALNPLRYRGYVYDVETDYYYLQSRYYDPEIGRFINADAFAATGQGFIGNNMFAYCGNNPVAFFDVTGMYYVSMEDRITVDGCAGGAVMPPPIKMIMSQKDEGVGNKRLGLSTVARSGCGVVATHNALLTLDNADSFDVVLDYYNGSPDRTVLGGFLGTLPHQVAEFFESRGYHVIMSNTPDSIEAFSRTADACILWYAYPAKVFGVDAFNAHFVHYRKYGMGYKAYNTDHVTDTFLHPYDFGDYGDRYCPIGIFIYK